MKVQKRNGEIQEFVPNKIRLSMSRASDETNMPLNAGDLDVLVKEATKNLENLNRDLVTSEEVFNAVLLTIEKNRFHEIAQKYREGANR